MVTDYSHILFFLFTGIGVMFLVFFAVKQIRPHKPNAEKLSTYESGEEPYGNANVQFNIRYYVIALVFILFEVELVFLFPWATVFANKHLNEITNGLWAKFATVEMFIFILLLALGLAYAWVKGLLDWVKPEPNQPNYHSKIPIDAYKNFKA